MAKAPRRPLGDPIIRTAAQREAASQITPMDILNARLLWNELAPARAKGLMEAKPEPPKDDGREPLA